MFVRHGAKEECNELMCRSGETPTFWLYIGGSSFELVGSVCRGVWGRRQDDGTEEATNTPLPREAKEEERGKGKLGIHGLFPPKE